jgi:hypothetical protein
VSEKLPDSKTVLFISQRRKPTKISTGHKAVVAFRSYKSRRSKRIDLKKSASLVVNLDRIPKRLPSRIQLRNCLEKGVGSKTASVPIENCLTVGVQSENSGTTWEQTLPNTVQNGDARHRKRRDEPTT